MNSNNDNSNNEKNTLLSIVAMIPFWMILGAMIGWRIGGNQGLCFGLVLGYAAGKIFGRWVEKDREQQKDRS